MVAKAVFKPLRSLAAGGISGTYAEVGTAFDKPCRGIRMVNLTQGDMIFSDDEDEAAGKWVVPAGSYVLWDVQSNMNAQFDDKYVLPVGTQIYVKQLTAPTDGAVYVEVLSE